jgi:hypothetical protein
VFQYIGFIKELRDAFPTREFFVVAMPHISMRLVEEVPSQSEMVVLTRDMLRAWGVQKASFIGSRSSTILIYTHTPRLLHRPLLRLHRTRLDGQE